MPTGTSPTLRRRFVTIDEASGYTGLAPRTLRDYITQGRLTGYRVGPRALRFDLDELEQLFRPIPAGGER